MCLFLYMLLVGSKGLFPCLKLPSQIHSMQISSSHYACFVTPINLLNQLTYDSATDKLKVHLKFSFDQQSCTFSCLIICFKVILAVFEKLWQSINYTTSASLHYQVFQRCIQVFLQLLSFAPALSVQLYSCYRKMSRESLLLLYMVLFCSILAPKNLCVLLERA